MAETRILGRHSKLQVPCIGLGCMGMSSFYGETRAPESAAVLLKVIELSGGKAFLDTSDMYGPYTNEELIGEVIKGKRDKYIIATKMGIVVKMVDGKPQLGVDGSRKHVREACEASLKRLGIECIDLYYLHRVDPNVPVEETFAELKLLVEEGLVKHVGISEATADEVRRAHKVLPLTAYQMEWSLWSRDVEAEIVPTCRELGIGIVPYSPLGRGFLTGALKSIDDLKPDDWRRTQPRFQEEAMKKNMEAVKKVEDLARSKGCSAAQLALAWVLHQGPDVVPIPGTTKVHRLEENMGAAGIKLTKEDIQLLEAAVPHEEVVGDRYDEAQMKRTHARR